MRVTQNITTSTFISYIHRHAENLLKTQQQIASQKRINKSSDDPIGMVLSRPLRDPPGSTWYYNGGLTQVIAGLIERKTGMPLDRFAEVALLGGSAGDASAVCGPRPQRVSREAH